MLQERGVEDKPVAQNEAVYRLTSITIPAGVTRIEEYTFHCCMNLTDVVIPEGVTSVGKLAFACCHELTNVVLPASLVEYRAAGFCGLQKLEQHYDPGGRDEDRKRGIFPM